MKKIFILCLFAIASSMAHSQTLTINDSQTGKPIDMVSIVCKSCDVFEVTNLLGQADISLFKEATQIEISRLGYRPQTTSFAQLEQLSFEIYMVASTIQFDEVVVSATRWSQTSKNIPSKISMISTQQVALYNPQTAADLLSASGEVFVQKSQQGGGSPMIRGFATNRLLYAVDGVRMNSAIFRAGNIQNVISLDPFAMENTEIFFGPGSIIYGSDAIGGVMSFQTLTPQLSLSSNPLITGKLVSRYSSANEEGTHHFDVSVGWKKWALVTSFTHSKFGNLRMGSHGTDEYLKLFYVQRIDNVDRVIENTDPLIQNPSGYTQTNLMQKIHFSPNKKWDFQYGLHYSETSQYSRYDRLIEMQTSGLPSSAVWNYGPQIWLMNNFSATHKGYNLAFDQFTLRLAHQYFEESRIDRKFNHYRLRTQLEQVQAYSVNFDFEKNANKHKFVYGVEYVLNDVNSIGSALDIRDQSPIAVPARYPLSQWSSFAGYVNYQYNVSELLLLQLGARYSGFNIQSDFTKQLDFFAFDFTTTKIQNSATTGSLGLVYKPTETSRISANLSTGFRAPNVDDIGKIFDFAAGEIVVPNADLKAEYAYNGELSLSKTIGEWIKLDITAFYTYLDAAMVRRAFQINGLDSIEYDDQMSKVYAIQNAAFATVFGFNAAIELKLPSGFGFSTRYNYQLGKEEMDNGEMSRSRHAAPAFGVTRFMYQKKQLQMQVYASYSAQVSYAHLNHEERQKPAIYATDSNGNPYSPSWYTLNFKAMYQFHENLSVSAGLENITDQRYRPYSSGLVASGRNLILSLRANF